MKLSFCRVKLCKINPKFFVYLFSFSYSLMSSSYLNRKELVNRLMRMAQHYIWLELYKEIGIYNAKMATKNCSFGA